MYMVCTYYYMYMHIYEHTYMKCLEQPIRWTVDGNSLMKHTGKWSSYEGKIRSVSQLEKFSLKRHWDICPTKSKVSTLLAAKSYIHSGEESSTRHPQLQVWLVFVSAAKQSGRRLIIEATHTLLCPTPQSVPHHADCFWSAVVGACASLESVACLSGGELAFVSIIRALLGTCPPAIPMCLEC